MRLRVVGDQAMDDSARAGLRVPCLAMDLWDFDYTLLMRRCHFIAQSPAASSVNERKRRKRFNGTNDDEFRYLIVTTGLP